MLTTKFFKTEGISEDGVKWKELYRYESNYLTRLFEIYSKDKYHAGIFYRSNINKDFSNFRTVLFEKSNSEFHIITMVRKFGISKTNRMYNREVVTNALRYKGGKFYFSIGSKFKVFCWSDLAHYHHVNVKEDVKAYLINKFGWLKNVDESASMHYVSLNTIKEHKLFNEKKFLRYQFKMPYNVIELLKANFNSYLYTSQRGGLLGFWKRYKDILVGIEKVNVSTVKHHMFYDTLVMGLTLGKKVNASWSLKRLRLEHDKFTKEISETLMVYEPYVGLNIRQIYKDFAEYSGFEMLVSNHDLIYEGKRMGHCVGTYINRVNSGGSCIFRVNGYTLEVNFMYYNFSRGFDTNGKYQLKFGQYRDFGNDSPPQKDIHYVKEMIDRFNNDIVTGDYLKQLKDIDMGLGVKATDDITLPW